MSMAQVGHPYMTYPEAVELLREAAILSWPEGLSRPEALRVLRPHAGGYGDEFGAGALKIATRKGVLIEVARTLVECGEFTSEARYFAIEGRRR